MQRCFKYAGPYKLASGRQSKYYYDGKGATQDPVAAWLIGNALMDMVHESGAEAVGGLELGAIPIADATALASYLVRGRPIPTFIVRKVAKSHGNRSQVCEANTPDGTPLLMEGRLVAIVDDVITTGGSMQTAIDVVRGLGCIVTTVIALVERHESENKALRGQGFSVSRLFYTNEEGDLFIDDDFARRVDQPVEAGLLSR
jgi:orotate phosphoribosyltransferase